MTSILRTGLAVLAAGVAAFGVPAHAADPAYPSRPIKIVVGFAPGGGGDGVARIMAEHMAKTLKQPITIENRPGAGATLGPAAVATAAPDGYTLLLAPDSVFGPDKALWKPNVKYDETSFTPISRWCSTFFVLAANKNFGVKTVAELVAKAKQSNNEVFVASTQGIYPSIIINNFNKMSGISMKQVPYKGGAPSVLAVVAGDVPVTFSVPSSIIPMVKEGKLNALAITADKRSPLTPDLPTLAESGMPGFNVGYWFALAGPAGMADDVVQKLFDASSLALADPGVRTRLAMLGYETTPSTSVAEFRSVALRDGIALRKVVEDLGLRGD